MLTHRRSSSPCPLPYAKKPKITAATTCSLTTNMVVLTLRGLKVTLAVRFLPLYHCYMRIIVLTGRWQRQDHISVGNGFAGSGSWTEGLRCPVHKKKSAEQVRPRPWICLQGLKCIYVESALFLNSRVSVLLCIDVVPKPL